ncbi:MAG TPA: IPT/TIG domain-containing protein [Anaeromyxobacter sp.]|nr:IPT/TIG domain-containing protein [Anaeromyxobacter sp.]
MSRLASLLLLLLAALAPRPAAGVPTGAEPPWPAVGSAQPPAGPSTGGTRVIIRGFAFQPGARVWFGLTEARDVELTATGELAATTGAHRPGRVAVTVLNPDGRRGSRGWTYRYLAAAPLAAAP